MRRVVVRYSVKAERVEEHRALIRGVFEALGEASPAGLDYEVLELADGRSFVHVATISGDDNPLTRLPAFKAFTADIAARCDEQPVSREATLVGGYRAAG